MTNKTTVGRATVAGLYTASLFIPLIGAIGAVTATKRSVSYGGSTNDTFSVIVVQDENKLVKVNLTFSQSAISQRTMEAASSIMGGTQGEQDTRLQPESESDPLIPMKVQTTQEQRFSQ